MSLKNFKLVLKSQAYKKIIRSHESRTLAINSQTYSKICRTYILSI